MKCKSLRESVRVVVLLDDLHAHTHALTLERMQAAANRRAPIKTRLRTHLMSFWTKFQLSIFASIINDVIKTSSKKRSPGLSILQHSPKIILKHFLG